MTDPTIDKAALEACPWCGLTEHLSLRAEGSYTPDMPARPYRVVCNHIDHDTVEGPIGYGRKGAIAAWNRRASPTTSPLAPEGAWPKRRANVPYQGQEHQRLVGFVIERGDEAFGEYGLSEPLAWLDRMCAASLPHQSPEGVRDGWVLVPDDLLTHIHDWRNACQTALDVAAPPTVDSDDKSYWRHQLSTLDRIEAALKGNRT